jgi:hypothetical protein
MNESEVMVEVTFKGEEPVIYVFDYYSVEHSKWEQHLIEESDDGVMRKFLEAEKEFNPETDTIKKVDYAYVDLGAWEDDYEG